MNINITQGRTINIDRAIEWLQNNAEDYVVTCYDRGELDIEGLIMDFRKAMEEQYEDMDKQKCGGRFEVVNQ